MIKTSNVLVVFVSVAIQVINATVNGEQIKQKNRKATLNVRSPLGLMIIRGHCTHEVSLTLRFDEEEQCLVDDGELGAEVARVTEYCRRRGEHL